MEASFLVQLLLRRWRSARDKGCRFGEQDGVNMFGLHVRLPLLQFRWSGVAFMHLRATHSPLVLRRCWSLKQSPGMQKRAEAEVFQALSGYLALLLRIERHLPDPSSSENACTAIWRGQKATSCQRCREWCLQERSDRESRYTVIR